MKIITIVISWHVHAGKNPFVVWKTCTCMYMQIPCMYIHADPMHVHADHMHAHVDLYMHVHADLYMHVHADPYMHSTRHVLYTLVEADLYR